MLHRQQLAVGVGLDAQLKGAAHGLKDHAGLAIADSGHGAVCAVAAFLRAQVRLHHIGHGAVHGADGELVFHIAVALAAAAQIVHRVKRGVQSEALAEARHLPPAGNTVQHAGHQHAAFSALIGIGHGIAAAFVAQLRNNFPTVRRFPGKDDLLALAGVGGH